MKRIAFVHPSSELYGSDRVLLDHLLLLDRERYSPLVFLSRQGPLSEHLSQAQIPWRLREPVSITRDRRTLKGLLASARGAHGWARTFESAKVDLVHSSTLACLGGALGARAAGLPHLWHVQEIPSLWAQRALTPLLAAAGGALAANSEATARWLRRAGFGARLHLVYPGRVAPSNFTPFPRAMLGVPAGSTCALLIGRLSPRKGQRLALEALEVAADPSLVLVIAGDEAPGHAGYRQSLRARIARSSAWQQVRLLRGQREAWGLLAASDLVLVPSLEPESFGLVALEAQLSQRPVLAMRQGGLPEVLGGDSEGLLTPEPEAWAAAWKELARDPAARVQRARVGLERAQRFTPARASQGLCTAYEALLA